MGSDAWQRIEADIKNLSYFYIVNMFVHVTCPNFHYGASLK